MLRVGSKLLAARPAALVSRVSHQTRQLTELEYKVDDAFRERMLRPERKGKRGRFYVIDPPVASHLAKVLTPLVKSRTIIQATPGPGVLTSALLQISKPHQIIALDHNGFYMETYEELQQSGFSNLKVLHANAIRLEAELPDSEEDDLLSAEMELFATFEDIMDHVPPPKRKDAASHCVIAPFGMETLHLLAVMIPQVYGQIGFFSKGPCAVIGAVACQKDDPILLGSAVKETMSPYYHAVLDEVFDVKVLEEFPASCVYNRTSSWPYGKKATIRFLSFTPKPKKRLPAIFDVALFRLVYPMTYVDLKTSVRSHIRTHGIDGKYITRIMEAAEIPEDAIISSVEPKKYWRMLQAYKNNCSEEFLEKLFVKLGVVTYTVEEEDYGARAVEAEENRRTTFNIGSGLDKSFWHIESGRYKKRDEVSSADGDEYDADALADMDDDR